MLRMHINSLLFLVVTFGYGVRPSDGYGTAGLGDSGSIECTENWANCLSTRCCENSDHLCYVKDELYAECRLEGSCVPEDGWTCEVLVFRAVEPTTAPTLAPMPTPTTMAPTSPPVSKPTTTTPTSAPIPKPTTMAPTQSPVPKPTTLAPTSAPISKPTTMAPTLAPTPQPTTMAPASAPIREPTTMAPTSAPVPKPTTKAPTLAPIPKPTTMAPTSAPIPKPTTLSPTSAPVPKPTTMAPTSAPIPKPTTMAPTSAPIPKPTTLSPTSAPIPKPTTMAPTSAPVPEPTTMTPTIAPVPKPTTMAPTPICAEDSIVAFSDPTILTSGADGAYYVQTVNLNGDQHLDILSAWYYASKLVWYENDGGSPPSFTEHTISSSTTGIVVAKAVDIDGDGDLDIITAERNRDFVVVYFSDGSSIPTFTELILTTSANGARDVVDGDFNGDGSIDVLACSEFDNTIALYLNNGDPDPSFTEVIVTSSYDGAFALCAADFDGDNDLDFVIASQRRNSIDLYENNGADVPTFTAHSVATDAVDVVRISCDDINGDGFVDILANLRRINTIALYFNDGSASFSSSYPVTTTATGVTGSSIIDINNDGALDVLSTHFTSGVIAWYENDGSGLPSFTEHIISTKIGDGPLHAAAGDITGDDKLDVVSANFLGDYFMWQEQICISEPTLEPDS